MGIVSCVFEAEGIQPKVTSKAVIVIVIITPDNPKNQFFRSPTMPKADAATRIKKSAKALSGAIILDTDYWILDTGCQVSSIQHLAPSTIN